jgi:hypothetical protein
VIGNKCHIVWKNKISIVINKLKINEDNFVCTSPEIQDLKLKFCFDVYFNISFSSCQDQECQP